MCLLQDPPHAQVYPLSLHDALPISPAGSSSAIASISSATPAPVSAEPKKTGCSSPARARSARSSSAGPNDANEAVRRSEEHTSELQSRRDIVCRLLLEKKNVQDTTP